MTAINDLIERNRKAHGNTDRQWKTQQGKYTGEDWLVCTLGYDSESDDDWNVTTDHIHASESIGTAKDDAEFIAQAHNDMPKLLACLERAVEGWTETYICSHCRGGGLEPPETTELPGEREDCHQCDGYGITINGESPVQFLSSLDRIAAKEQTE